MALGFGLAWAVCARPRPVAPPPLPARLPAGVLPDRLVWSGSARLSPRVWTQWPAFVLVVLPQFHLLTSWWSLPTVAVAAVTLLAGLRHLWGEVTVGAHGIRVRTRPGGVRWSVPWADVGEVDVVDVDVVDTVPVRRFTSRRVQLRSGPALPLCGRVVGPGHRRRGRRRCRRGPAPPRGGTGPGRRRTGTHGDAAVSQRARDLLVPAASLAAVIALTGVAADRLPDPVAMRFADDWTRPGSTGRAVGFLPRWVDLWLWPALAAAAVAATARTAPLVRTRRTARHLLGVANGVALVVVMLRVVVLVANEGQEDAATATFPSLLPRLGDSSSAQLMVGASLALALGSGLARLLSGLTRPVAPPPLLARPPRGVRPEGLVWTGRSRMAPQVLLLSTSGMLPFLVAAPFVAGAAAVIWPIMFGVVVLMTLRRLWCDVAIGPAGIGVRTRPFGVRWQIDWHDVVMVEVVDVDASDVRTGHTQPGRKAMLRPGPALRVLLADASAVVATVDGAEVGAAVAARHLDLHRATCERPARVVAWGPAAGIDSHGQLASSHG